ncbi:MAG TPA: hypothetical protein VFB32_09495, partial [Rudaea sp.]|nr:hypothetical protein [Rudaea sp.]
MILAVLHRSRARIAAVSAISALAGVANIWLLALIGRNAQLATPGVFEAAEFAAALACMFSINFLSQLVLSKLSAALFYRLREQLVHGMGALTTQEIDAIGRHRLHAALTK